MVSINHNNDIDGKVSRKLLEYFMNHESIIIDTSNSNYRYGSILICTNANGCYYCGVNATNLHKHDLINSSTITISYNSDYSKLTITLPSKYIHGCILIGGALIYCNMSFN